MPEYEEDKRTAPEDSNKDDLFLVQQLAVINAEQALRVIVPNAPPTVELINYDPVALVTAEAGTIAVEIPKAVLDQEAPLIMDSILNDADELIDAGQFGLALGRIEEGVRRLINSLFRKGLNLDAIYDRADRLRGQIARIADGLGASDFTLEFVISFPPSLGIGLHFNTRASLSAT